MNLLTEMQYKVLNLLAPLVEDLTEFGVQEIQVQEFSTAADLDELLERFRTIMPAAFLNLPRVTYGNNPNGLRITDATLSYGFLIGMADRRTDDVRQEFARELQQRQAQHLQLRQLDSQGISCSRVDFLQLQTWEYTADIDVSAALLTFDVTVKNWQMNTPA